MIFRHLNQITITWVSDDDILEKEAVTITHKYYTLNQTLRRIKNIS